MGPRQWATRMRTELARLPDTLADLSAGAANLRAVSERLERATVVLERAAGHLDASGVSEALGALDDAAVRFERQMAEARTAFTGATPGGGRVEEAARELQRNLERGMRLMPGWRTPGREP